MRIKRIRIFYYSKTKDIKVQDDFLKKLMKKVGYKCTGLGYNFIKKERDLEFRAIS